MIRKILSVAGSVLSVGFVVVACVGSWNTHCQPMPVRQDTFLYVQEYSLPNMVELAPLPDYVASDKSDIYRYNPYLEWTEEEKDILIRIAQAEAGNQGTIGMALVMRVVLNRVEKNGTDIKTEVFSPNQFAVGGMAPGTWETYEALDMVQTGWDESQGALFFCADGYNGPEPLFRYKGHWFSK